MLSHNSHPTIPAEPMAPYLSDADTHARTQGAKARRGVKRASARSRWSIVVTDGVQTLVKAA